MEFSVIKPVMWGSFIAVAMIQLAGCQRSDGNEGRATPMKPTPGASAQSRPGSDKPIDANWRVFNMKVLNDSHQFFSESWKIVMKDRNVKVDSVFSESLRLIQELVDEKGVARTEKAGAKCVQVKNGVKIEYREAGDEKSKTLKQTPVKLTLQTQDCSGKALKPIAEFRMIELGQIEMRFFAQALQAGAGARLAAANTEITCLAGVLNTARVIALNCKNLGQSVSTDRHESFTSFVYNAKASRILEFKTQSYDANFKAKTDGVYQIEVTVPAEGRIQVAEVSPGSKAGTTQTKAVAEDLEPATEPSPLIKPADLAGAPTGEIKITPLRAADPCEQPSATQQGDQRDIDAQCEKAAAANLAKKAPKK